MQFVNCPSCGGRLMEGEDGSRVRVKCNKCGKLVNVGIDRERITVCLQETGKRETKE